ncbi:hypothetical protein CR513_37981, partial [Mucuna pruriens]
MHTQQKKGLQQNECIKKRVRKVKIEETKEKEKIKNHKTGRDSSRLKGVINTIYNKFGQKAAVVHTVNVAPKKSLKEMPPITFMDEDFKGIKSYNEKLISFPGYINLTTFGVKHSLRIIFVRYLLVNTETLYNILINRPILNELGAIVSTPYLAMKFLFVRSTIVTIYVDKKIARQCYVEILKISKPCGGRKKNR